MVTAKNIYTYIALRLFNGSDKKYKTKKNWRQIYKGHMM